MQVHLVDATYELFRAHFSPRPPVLGRDGVVLSGVSGLVEQLLFLLREQGATHVGCATDRVIRSFRNDLYPGYKTEAGMDPELLAQFPVAEAAIEALGLVLWPMVEYEADDAIAAAADRFAADPRVERVVICTPDKDMAQCVRGERVVLWDRRRDLVYDEAGVRAKWGVPPSSVADRLALVGDAADGFPGLPGWGDKSASAVLARYGTLEAIPARRRRLGRARASAAPPRSPPRSATAWTRRSCTATWPACARPPTACRSPRSTWTSSAGAGRTAPAGRRSATSGGSARLREPPTSLGGRGVGGRDVGSGPRATAGAAPRGARPVPRRSRTARVALSTSNQGPPYGVGHDRPAALGDQPGRRHVPGGHAA